MGYAWEYLERLTAFAHRGSATREEAAAADAARDWFASMGYEVEMQSFRTPKETLYLGPAAVSLAFLIAGAAGCRVPWLGLLICLLFLLPLVGEMMVLGRLDLDLLLPRYPSQNVIARRLGAATVAGRRPAASPDPGRRTVVVSGHYDTQRATLLFHPAFVRWLQPYFYLVYGLLMAMPAALVLRWALPGRPWTGTFLAAVGGLIALNALFLVICARTGGYINGANDNGSGAALVLGLARHFAQEELPDTDLLFVLTGAEEVGTRGMKAFMQRCRLDPGSTLFINLDNLGGGTLHYLKGEGMLTVTPYSPALITVAEEVGRQGLTAVRPKANLLLPTDGLIPARAGYQAISFLAFLDDGSLPNYHWYTDTLERVDRSLVEAVERYMVAYVRRSAAVCLQGR